MHIDELNVVLTIVSKLNQTKELRDLFAKEIFGTLYAFYLQRLIMLIAVTRGI